MLCGWEGNRRSGVAPAMRGLSTYTGSMAFVWEMSTSPTPSGHGTFYNTLILTLLPSSTLSERRRYCDARQSASVCVSTEPRLHAALVSAAKVTRCIQCSLVLIMYFYLILI